MNHLAFVKMQGLGNDFVVFDRREGGEALSPQLVQRIADRRFGVGCDQVLVLEPSAEAHAFMRIFNPDGSEAEACGNGTRCVARLLMDHANARAVAIETVAGVLEVDVAATGYTVDMGAPRASWQEIPLGREADTDALPLSKGPLANPVAVNIGNPHAVFFVADLTTVPLHELGPVLEHDAWFPERANIEVAQVLDRRRLRVRVWERGAGITLACGSGACAALVAAVRRGLAERTADVMLDGGTLRIDWRDDGRVLMTGPAGVSFRGELAPELVEALPA